MRTYRSTTTAANKAAKRVARAKRAATIARFSALFMWFLHKAKKRPRRLVFAPAHT